MTQTEFQHTLLLARPKMMRVAMRFFRNREDAEDVVQEVCMRMIERGWHDGDNTEALLIKATKNLCVSIWRRQRKASSVPSKEEESGEAADAPLLRQEQKEVLEQAIGRLTPSEQRLIRMKGEELSLDEIAEQTGFSKRTASTMLWQAKKRLLTILKITNHD
jgi:RNA polymerase sigma factor (sigma-70 family)